MKVYIDSSPTLTGHSHRGIGQYTRMLIGSIKKYTDIRLVDSVHEADLVHYPFFDLFFLTLPLFKRRPTVVTIHDVIPLLYPAAYPKGIRGFLKQTIQTLSLGNTSHIVTDSNVSTADVINFLKQPAEKVETVYLAADPSLSPASKEDIDETLHHFGLYQPYLLYVGDINYNKNLPALFEAVSRLKTPIDLVMVSKPMIRSNPAAASLWNEVDRLHIGDRLRVLTDVPHNDLKMIRSLYSGTSWYIQPSLYEGFGLPVLEAQACGAPVLCSTGGSLQEIAGDSTLSFNPENIEMISTTLTRAVEMKKNERDEYIEKGMRNTKRFSWQKTVATMKTIYEQTVS